MVTYYTRDFDVKIGGVSYYKEWVKLNISQAMSEPSQFSLVLGGISGVPFAVGTEVNVHYNNDETTPVFKGLITNMSFQNFRQVSIEGMDYSKKLLGEDMPQTGKEKKYTTQSTSLEEVIKTLCSKTNNWQTYNSTPTDRILEVDIDDMKIEQLDLPIKDKLTGLFYLDRLVAERYFYVGEEDGVLYVKSTKGSVGTPFHYYLTGVNTNSYFGNRSFTGENIRNSVTVLGSEARFCATFSDYSPIESTLVSGDNFLSSDFSVDPGGSPTCDATMYLKQDTTGIPNSGIVLLRHGQLTEQALGFETEGYVCIQYTGKTSNTLTGCSVSGVTSPTATDFKFHTNHPVLNMKIVVADASSFAPSGELVIADESFDYDSITGNTFNLSYDPLAIRSRHVLDTTFTVGTHTEYDTIINVVSTTGFPASGLLSLYTSGGETEIIYYSGKTATTFTGVVRDADITCIELPASTLVSYMNRHLAHPTGIIVKQGVDKVAQAGSSIEVNGLHAKTVIEPSLSNQAAVERLANQIFKNYRWGDSYNKFYPIDMERFDAETIGNKVLITDSSLGLVAYPSRIMGIKLNLDRTSAYNMTLETMPYEYAFTMFGRIKNLADIIKMLGIGKWLS